jgi:hypothetical protein
VQVGLVSWGRGCAVYPGVYSRISEVYTWIRDQICYKSVDPPSYMQCQDSERNPIYVPAVIAVPPAPTPPPTQSPTLSSSYPPTWSPVVAIIEPVPQATSSSIPKPSTAPSSRPSQSSVSISFPSSSRSPIEKTNVKNGLPESPKPIPTSVADDQTTTSGVLGNPPDHHTSSAAVHPVIVPWKWILLLSFFTMHVYFFPL